MYNKWCYGISNQDRVIPFPLVWYTFSFFKGSWDQDLYRVFEACVSLSLESEALAFNGSSANISSIFKVSSVPLLEVPITDQR